MPDAGLKQGKIVLVTGATDGIGKVTARRLAELGATVLVAGRNPAKTDAVVKEIRAQTGNAQVEGLVADLALLAGVRALAAQVLARWDRLDVLLNNAGAMFMSRQVTAEGLERTFALNHMGYFLLTHLLLERLKASRPARIVNVSSAAHFGARLNLEDVQLTRGYNGLRAYNNSKLLNLLFTYALARRLEGTGVTANALHPGLVATQFFANNWGPVGKIGRKLIDLVSISAEKGAETSVYLASAPEVAGVNGQYFERNRARRSSAVSYDEAAQERLWEISAALAETAAD